MYPANSAHAYTATMDRFLTTVDDVQLYIHQWLVPEPARGTALIVHGLGEHIGRYSHVAHYLNSFNWNVVGYDLRGHGKSGGPRGRIKRNDSLLTDLSLVIDYVRQQHPNVLMLLGHSLGGSIAARFVAEGLTAAPAIWHRPVEALILSSPAFDPDISLLQRVVLSLVSPVIPNLPVHNGVKPNYISRQTAVVRAYQQDPLVHDRITPRLARFAVDAGKFVQQHANQWKTPTLLMYGGSDRCVAPQGSARFAAAAPRTVVNVREFPPLFHEIFNEPEQTEVLATFR